MKSLIFFAILSVLLLSTTAMPRFKEMSTRINIPRDQQPSHVINPTPDVPITDLPTNFSWHDQNGKSYLTVMKNHHFPEYCGGCYSFASTSSISDRIKIMRNAQWPDITLAPQVLLSCSANYGCHGGGASIAHQYIQKYGITDESCSPYQARGHENGAPCTDEIKCQTCDSEGNCEVPESYPVYYVSEYGYIEGEKAIMNEVYARGPVACLCDSDLIWNYTSGIVNITAKSYDLDHYVSIYGWGEEDGIPFWYIRNSWGSFWGEDGNFRVQRGINSIGIEETCDWAVPEDTWTNDVRNHSHKATKSQSSSFIDALFSSYRANGVKKDPKYEGFTSKSGSFPWSHLDVKDLPASWDWRNVSDTNYLSWTTGQNAPHNCQSGWAEAATSALADRIMIARNSTFPSITLSSQALINCQAGGDCSGGDPLGVYEFASKTGIPDYTCQAYVGENPDSFECSAVQLCSSCNPPAPYPNGTDPHDCENVTEYVSWKVSDYGRVSGSDEMKKAIYNDGPIVCGIKVTDKFEAYTGGVFSQYVATTSPNHEVSIVGWGVDDQGAEYWIGRNSWGNYWGEFGYFRINMGSQNLGIENGCVWAIPDLKSERESMTNRIFDILE